MTTPVRPTKISFEERYSDDSGVEFAVRFRDKFEDQIEFQHIQKVSFPIGKLRWLIDSLLYIEKETKE